MHRRGQPDVEVCVPAVGSGARGRRMSAINMIACYESRGRVVAMRRLITLVTIFVAALLGFAAVAVPAQAKVPGPDGQIVFGRFNTGLGDFQIFTANPTGPARSSSCPALRSVRAGHRTG